MTSLTSLTSLTYLTSLEIVLITLGVGTTISVMYLIIALIRRSKQMMFSGIIMLFSQPAGIIYYFGAFVMRYVGKRDIDFDELSFSQERRGRPAMPDVRNEMEAVPLEEAFLMSANSDKRKRLLFELKKDHVGSLGVITKAFDNEDSETSHYAAAAIASIRAEFEGGMRKLDNAYNKAPNEEAKLVAAREYSNYILEFLNSGMLNEMDMEKYSYLYVNIITAVDKPSFFSDEDYANIVDKTLYVSNYQLAERWATTAFAATENEQSYLNLLKVYFYTNRSEQFFETLEKLKKSDIALSQDGIALVRFFL